MIEELENKFTKYEIARILGARALQIAMDAPLLLKIDEKELEEINYNPIEIAKRELIADVLPITVSRPLPKKREEKIKPLTKEQIKEKLKKEKGPEKEAKKEPGKEIEKEGAEESMLPKDKDSAELKSDEALGKEEESEERKIEEDAEIMELANPEDEGESELEETEEAE